MRTRENTSFDSGVAWLCGVAVAGVVTVTVPLAAITIAIPDSRVPLTLLLQRQQAALERTPDSYWSHRGLARTHALAATWRFTGPSKIRAGGFSGDLEPLLWCDPCAHVDYRTPDDAHVVRGNQPREDWLEQGTAGDDLVEFHRRRAIEHYREALRLAHDQLERGPPAGRSPITGLQIDTTELGLSWNLLQTGSEEDRVEAKRRLQEIVARQEADREAGPGRFGEYARDSSLMGPLLAEAIDYLLPLLGDDEEAERERLRALHDRLGHGASAVTPLAIDLRESRGSDPVDSVASVTFDLDLTGSRVWTWPRRGVAWLVWSPGGATPIEDGSQLFGSRSFGMAHPHGFAALCLLDADGDSWLRGSELEGLALWFDGGDGGEPDGRSTNEEISPLAVSGIIGLHCAPASIRAAGGHLKIRDGVERRASDRPGESVTTRLDFWDLVLSPREPATDAGTCPRDEARTRIEAAGARQRESKSTRGGRI